MVTEDYSLIKIINVKRISNNFKIENKNIMFGDSKASNNRKIGSAQPAYSRNSDTKPPPTSKVEKTSLSKYMDLKNT